jgi:hypothetical protein
MGPVLGLLLGRGLPCRRVIATPLPRVASIVRLESTYRGLRRVLSGEVHGESGNSWDMLNRASEESGWHSSISRRPTRGDLEALKGRKRKAQLRKKEDAGERLTESETLEKKGWSAKYTAKVRQAEKEWAVRANKIEAGEIQNTFDMLEERGFIKDVTG